jgi:peptide/nickel transport system substrate-binding protein
MNLAPSDRPAPTGIARPRSRTLSGVQLARQAPCRGLQAQLRPFLAAMTAWLFAAMLGAAPPATAQEFRMAMSSEPNSMDPHYHNLFSNINVSEHVFESLIKLDSDSRIIPGLAESWRLVDPTTWEFKLRKGVKFHDGSDLTAEDVAFSLDRPAQVPNSPGPFTLYTKQIAGKEVVDPLTIRLKTPAPYPLMLNDLTTIFVVSKKNVQGLASEDFSSGKGMVGTGPFKFASFKRGDRLELVRNDAYWGPKPAWEKVTVRFIAADPTRIAALLSGDVDAIENVPTADLPKIRNNPSVNFFQKVSHRVIYFTLDQGRDPTPFAFDKAGKPLAKNPFKDLRVRQAVDRAINRQAIAERVMEGLALPTANLVPAPMFGNNPALKVTPYDPEGAKKLLADAGYPDGFALTIHGPNNRYVNDDQILQAVAQMLTRAGIQTRVEAMPLASFFPRANKKEFTMALVGWGAQTGEVSSPLRSILATIDVEKGMGTVNYGFYSNAKMDALLAEALRTVDDPKREKLLQEATAVAIQDVGMVPVHHQFTTWAARKGVTYTPRTDERTYAWQFRPN